MEEGPQRPTTHLRGLAQHAPCLGVHVTHARHKACQSLTSQSKRMPVINMPVAKSSGFNTCGHPHTSMGSPGMHPTLAHTTHIPVTQIIGFLTQHLCSCTHLHGVAQHARVALQKHLTRRAAVALALDARYLVGRDGVAGARRCSGRHAVAAQRVAAAAGEGTLLRHLGLCEVLVS